jgi:hypothetical protein
MIPRALRLLVLVLLATPALAPAARLWIVAQQHPAADDEGPGTEARPFRSVAPAAHHAVPGDTIRIHAGTYRERVAPAAGGEPGLPITYEGAPGEIAVLSGSDPLPGPWREEPDGLSSHPLGDLGYETHWQPFRTPIRRLPGLTCGLLFADGRRLAQARSRAAAAATPGTWWYDPDTDRVLVRFPPGPRPRLVEAAARERVFAPRLRGLGHLVVRGLVIQHAAGQFPSGFWLKDDRGYPQAGALGTRSGHDWIIENNLIRENAALGLDLGIEGGRDPEGLQPAPADHGRHLVRANVLEANGAGGIAGYRAPGVRIEGNIVRGSNWQGHTAPEAAGIKLHFAYDVRIEGNHVHDNDAYGIWLDNVYTGARVERNFVHGNGGAGIFFELGGGPGIAAWNIVAENQGDGIYLHDASDVLIAHNLVALNRQLGIHARTVTDRRWTDRERGDAPTPVGTHRVRVLNNLFIDNGGGAISLPFPSPTSSANHSDHNLYLARTQWQLQIDLTRLWHLNLNDGVAAIPPQTRRAALAGLDPAAADTGYLTLENWRAFTGQDHSSRAQIPGTHIIENGALAQGGFAFRGLGGWLRFARSEAINSQPVPPLPELEGALDYLGQKPPDPASPPRPGPLQNLPDGEVTLRLWPRPAPAP